MLMRKVETEISSLGLLVFEENSVPRHEVCLKHCPPWCLYGPGVSSDIHATLLVNGSYIAEWA